MFAERVDTQIKSTWNTISFNKSILSVRRSARLVRRLWRRLLRSEPATGAQDQLASERFGEGFCACVVSATLASGLPGIRR